MNNALLWLMAVMLCATHCQVSARIPRGPLLFLDQPEYMPEFVEVEPQLESRLAKRAVKRERILDSLGGDYLIRKRTI